MARAAGSSAAPLQDIVCKYVLRIVCHNHETPPTSRRRNIQTSTFHPTKQASLSPSRERTYSESHKLGHPYNALLLTALAVRTTRPSK